MRLSSLSENSDYDFPSSLKNQDPVLVSVLTARGGGLDFEDEEVDDVEEGAEAESTEASDEKSSEETNSDNSEENPNNLLDLCIIGLGIQAINTLKPDIMLVMIILKSFVMIWCCFNSK